jgi:undecaprenyl diphosphate synthase
MIFNDREPKHVAIIMDGNGRWAKARGRDRVMGHIKGARVAKKIVEQSVQLKLNALTLYAFSEENWSRPVREVNFLMRLLSRYIIKERKSLIKNNIRFRCIGNLERIPNSVKAEVEETMHSTAKNTGMVLTFALSYGGRQELVGAIKQMVNLANNQKINSQDITEDFISGMLQTAPLCDPDLLIRTSGEWRLSNFLPWQTIYTELYFTNTLWPDFTINDYKKALISYSNRERRYGNVLTQEDELIQIQN